ncbi:hypothetical protein SDC9_19474 [bioreactor metagenome]|uniref:Uncharacterized protein n=1 Tax=bioreactor metagenome TaxID=1076179 RepID=A0A644U322_9ZZZZ
MQGLHPRGGQHRYCTDGLHPAAIGDHALPRFEPVQRAKAGFRLYGRIPRQIGGDPEGKFDRVRHRFRSVTVSIRQVGLPADASPHRRGGARAGRRGLSQCT